MSNEIIDFYKKAIEEKESPIEPVLEKEDVLEETAVVPEDPFKKFLFELTDKLKDSKIEESEKLDVINEVVEEEKKELEKNPTVEKDVFGEFLNDFSNIINKEINEKEKQIKDTAIDFIEKLKTQPPTKKKSPKKILDKIKVVEELENKPEPIIQKNEDKNTYVDQLATIDKTDKVAEKVKEKTNLKSLVAKQVKEELEKFKVQFSKLALEGGGGSVAAQFAAGGTMKGDLNVTGKYLSAGIDLASLFSGGGGQSDRLVSGDSSLILNPEGTVVFPDNTIRPEDNQSLSLESENPELSAYSKIVLSPYAFFAYDSEGNSITFDKVENSIVLTSQDEYEWTFNNEGILVGPNNTLTVTSLSSLGRILSGGKDLHEIFLTAETDSQTLTYDIETELLSISNGNTVSLSSLNDKNYTNSKFLNLTGGTLAGNLTVQGNISALGTAAFTNTIFTTTSSISVVNTGIGPALYVFQAAGPYDVASFYDGDGIEVLHVGNAGLGGLGKVGINESFPNEELTVRGSISATESVFATSFLSGGIDLTNIFLTAETDSQTLYYTESSAELSISNGNTVSLSALSATPLDKEVNTIVITNSGNWIDTSTVVQQNSANWSLSYSPQQRSWFFL